MPSSRSLRLACAATGIAALAIFVVMTCGESPAPAAFASLGTPDAALIGKGRYLATAGDCVACHTRKGGTPFAGGVPLDTPFGTLYSANITPDLTTGIGSWSIAQFAQALREGIAPDGTHLYPAFPYTSYTKVTDEDVVAIYAYLRSLAPVKYTPPANELGFPFNVRSFLAVWKASFFEEGRYTADAAQSAEWNRGAYLTQGLGHCGACHTPRNILGGERASKALTGGVLRDEIPDAVVNDKITPMDEPTVRFWSTPNLTPVSNGLGAWSVEQIAAYLMTGHNERAGAFGPMRTVVMNSTRHLTAQDARAIAVYLNTLPALKHGAVNRPRAGRLRAGEIVYATHCVDCHQSTGLGMPRVAGADPSKTAPPLVGNAVLQAPDPATLINVILYGAHEATLGSESWPMMSGFELSVGLDDEQIAALATYVRSSWGNDASAVEVEQVTRQH